MQGVGLPQVIGQLGLEAATVRRGGFEGTQETLPA